MTNITLKATISKIELGAYSLDVFLFEDGTYGFTYEWLADLLQINKKLLSDKKSIWGLFKLTKGRLVNGSVNPKVKVLGITYVYLKADQLIDVMTGCAELEPSVFIPFLSALAMETLERRAAKAFNILFDETEANEKLKARISGKETRRTLTDAIKDWLDRHTDVSQNTKNFIYTNCSEAVNKSLFGLPAKKLVVARGFNESTPTRDCLTTNELKQLDHVEGFAIKLIDKQDVYPLEAVKDSLDFYS